MSVGPRSAEPRGLGIAGSADLGVPCRVAPSGSGCYNAYMAHRRRPNYRHDLALLRAAGLLYIIGFWHLFDYSLAPTWHHRPAGQLLTWCMLGLFSYISGWLLSRRYVLDSPSQILRFYGRRLVRIYPLFLVALAAFFRVGLVDPVTFRQGALLLNMITGRPLVTLWFVTMILLFYGLTPAYLCHPSTTKTIVLTAALWAALVALHLSTGAVDLRLAQYLIPYAGGILAARSPALAKALQDRRWLAASPLVAVVTALAFTRWDDPLLRSILADIAIAGTLPLFLLIGRVLSRRLPPVWIGRVSQASFCAYLIHRLTYQVGTTLWKPTSLPGSLFYLLGILLPATIGLGWLIQRGYDSLVGAIRLGYGLLQAVRTNRFTG
jgi:peptidoglycan/LPS O-acetylase OafA/YrhL